MTKDFKQLEELKALFVQLGKSRKLEKDEMLEIVQMVNELKHNIAVKNNSNATKNIVQICKFFIKKNK